MLHRTSLQFTSQSTTAAATLTSCLMNVLNGNFDFYSFIFSKNIYLYMTWVRHKLFFTWRMEWKLGSHHAPQSTEQNFKKLQFSAARARKLMNTTFFREKNTDNDFYSIKHNVIDHEMDIRKLLDLLFFFPITSWPEIWNIRGSQVHLSTGLLPPRPQSSTGICTQTHLQNHCHPRWVITAINAWTELASGHSIKTRAVMDESTFLIENP